MSEFTSSTPSDDEFSSFLEGINNEPTLEFDEKLLAADLELKFQSVLDEADFQPIGDDNERSELLMHELLATIGESNEEDVYIEATAAHYFSVMEMNEQYMLATIKMTLFSVEYDIANGVIDPEAVLATKAKLYTDLLVKQKLDQDSPLLSILNKSLPGPELQPDDPSLSPYFIASMEELANDEERKRDDLAPIDEACVFLGIDPNDYSDENAKLKLAISQLVFTGRMQFDAQNASANREERIRKTARDFSVEEDIVKKVIQFIEQKFPIK